MTHQDRDLVSAVAECFTDLGFGVEDADATVPDGAARVEDLRVTEEGWTTLVEVRGYKAGAKTADLGKLQRYARLYRAAEAREPDALWYVVNQFLGDDPRSRRPALSGTPEDVEVFAAVGGLVLDTRDLLRLWLAVARGELGASDARRILRAPSGVLSFPAEKISGK